MTDIRTNYCVACKEMADRIEALETEAAENARIVGMSAEREMALRGEVERLLQQLTGAAINEDQMHDINSTLRAEVERLRRALGSVIEEWDRPYYGDTDLRIDCLFDVIEPARAALEGTSHE